MDDHEQTCSAGISLRGSTRLHFFFRFLCLYCTYFCVLPSCTTTYTIFILHILFTIVSIPIGLLVNQQITLHPVVHLEILVKTVPT
jgi:hypothetical protein